MKQLLKILILSNCFFYETIAQNLVPNYSFENFTSCPSNYSQIGLAYPWSGYDADFFHSCTTYSYISAPYNEGPYGFQIPRTGSGYAVLWAINGIGTNYREYLHVQLLDSLQSGKCYYVEFYANLLNGWVTYAVNNMGLHFSTSPITSSGNVLNLTSHILGYNNTVLYDTLNWVKIAGVYSSLGEEKYITIGNFFDDVNTDTLYTGNGTYPGARYYIDDVSVIPIDSIPGGMPAFAGNDTSIVIGDSVFIGQEITNLNCNWYNSSGTLIASSISGIFVQPTATTYYVVEQNLCGTITYDTVNVTVQPVGANEFIQKSEAFRIYPNPSTGTIYLQSNNNASNLVSILITDVTGKLVYSNNNIILNNDVSKIDLDVDNGVYFIHIQDLNANQKSIKKIVINK
jgi:hypothetical protein